MSNESPAAEGGGVDIYTQALKVLAVPRFKEDVALALQMGGLAPLPTDKGRKSRGKKSLRGGTVHGARGGKKEPATDVAPPPQTFWSHVEDYFRAVTAEDVTLIQPPSARANQQALTMPPLGRHYLDVWADEDLFAREKAMAAVAQQGATRVKRKLLAASPVSKKRKITSPLGPDPEAAVLTTVISPQEEEAEDEVCHVCAGGDFEDSNKIVFCDNCDVAVHQYCYGISTVPEGQWLCVLCQVAGSPQAPPDLPCVLCPIRGGAVKPVAPPVATAKSQLPRPPLYAHLFCAQWIPDTYIEDTVAMEPICNVEGISKERLKLQCGICKLKHGACVQCSHGKLVCSLWP